MDRHTSSCHFGQSIDDDRHGPYKHHFVCFTCRKAWKPHANTKSQFNDSCAIVTKCPQCGGMVWDCGPNFKAPKRNKVKAWKRLQRAVTYQPTYHRGDTRREGLRMARAWKMGKRLKTTIERWKEL